MTQEIDLGMLYFPEFHLVARIHQDKKGRFVKIPKLGKCYIEQQKETAPK
jgi:hypothetical protein